MPAALSIETSCDDCSVSIVKDTGEVLFLEQKTQDQIHESFGGVVPELASREHEKQLLPLIEQALKTIPLRDIDLIAAANRPGLLGSLLVGAAAAKILSLAWSKPLIGVNHIEAHIFSAALFKSSGKKKQPLKLDFPALGFVVSGGHSCLFQVEGVGKSVLIAETRDDSAGEAFDKFARSLGLPWPGGPFIDKLAQSAPAGKPPDKKSFFSKIKTKGLSFSFSGIKSQGQRLIENNSSQWMESHKALICKNYQETIVEHLMDKLEEAFHKKPFKQVLVGGGVSANSCFRERLKKWSEQKSIPCFLPEKTFCADNGAMIGWTGLQYFLKGQTDGLQMPCSPRPLDKDFFIKAPKA